VQLELSRVRHEGTEDPALALKWRFFEAGAFSMAAKPAVSDGYRRVDLAGAYGAGRLELIAHAGYAKNRVAGERESLRHASLALLWALRDDLGLVLDLLRDTNAEKSGARNLYTRVVGLTWEAAENADLGFGRKAGDERGWLLGLRLRW
jgi:hypothetical protein